MTGSGNTGGNRYSTDFAVTFTAGNGGTAAGIARIGCKNTEGRVINLHFLDALTVTAGKNLMLNGNYVPPSGGCGILVLKGGFGNWYEVSRR